MDAWILPWRQMVDNILTKRTLFIFFALVSRHRSDVVGRAQPWQRSARRIAQPIQNVVASDATPRCASMASADRQMIGDATLASPACRSPTPVHSTDQRKPSTKISMKIV